MVDSEVLSDVTARLKIRKRRSLWRRVRWYLLGAGGLALVGVGVWLIWFSSVLAAREVTVQGAAVVSSNKITSVAAVPLGTPLMRINTKAIKQRVEGLPEVLAAKVSTKWPRTVLISITERTAAYQLFNDGHYSWIDANGVIFRTNGVKDPQLPVAQTVTMDVRLLRDIATVVHVLPKQLRQRLQLISAATPDRLELQLDQKTKVIWGSADQSELKAKVLQVLMEVQATIYDVSSPENPITK